MDIIAISLNFMIDMNNAPDKFCDALVIIGENIIDS